MSLFGMIIFIAWVGICLAAGRVYLLFGFWAFVVAVAAGLRVAGEVAVREGRGEPLGQARRGLLHASSGVVVTVITGAGLFGLMTPLAAIGLLLQWLDTWLGFTSLPSQGLQSTLLTIVLVPIFLGTLALSLVLGFGTLIIVGGQLWPVAPDSLRGCLALLRPLGVAGLVLAVCCGIMAQLQAIEHERRVDRIAGWAEAARRERAARLRSLPAVERGPDAARAARLHAQADHAGRVARAEEDRIAELRAEWRSSWVSWTWLPWAATLAALALVALAVRRVRQPGGGPPAAGLASWVVRLPSHRALDRPDPDPYSREEDPSTDLLSAEEREAPTRSWPTGILPPASTTTSTSRSP